MEYLCNISGIFMKYLLRNIHVLSQSRMEDCMSIPAGWLCYLSPEVSAIQTTETNKQNQNKTNKTNQQINKHAQIWCCLAICNFFLTCQRPHHQHHLIFHRSGDPGAEGSPATVRGLALHQVFTSPSNIHSS